MMAPTIAFRFDMDNSIGGGHCQRCLALADFLPPDRESLFLVRGDQAALARALGSRRHLILPADLPLTDEPAFLRQHLNTAGFEALFFDIAHSRTYSQVSALPAYVAAFAGSKRVLIDGLRRDSVLTNGGDCGFDYVVTPYVGAETAAGGFRHLAGPDYFILPKSTLTHRPGPREIAPRAERLILTMGRSDPESFSLPIIRALAKDSSLKITLVVGDLFAPPLAAELRRLATSHPSICLMENEKDLLPHFARHDLALVSAGLTKYELAFAGTPGIFFSGNEVMQEINELFATAGSGLALGPLPGLSETIISSTIEALLRDQLRREAMAQAGRRLIDGLGASRLLAEVLKEKHG